MTLPALDRPAPPPLTPVICGPTAGGKSDLAVSLALAVRERLGVDAEIVTADAFQVYRGMDIGTAKPSAEERRGVRHHLIDLVDPHDGTRSGFTVDDWLRLANAKIDELRAANTLPIVVGGTHLYIKALVDGLFEGPEPDPALRAELAAMDPSVRRAELERVDPAAAARIHPNDMRRTVRALEVYRLTGRPISSHQTQWDAGSARTPVGEAPGAMEASADALPTRKPDDARLLVLLNWETEALNRRINARVRQMIDRGLLDEIRGLLGRGPLGAQPAEALGYKQLLPLLAPGQPQPPPPKALDEAIERIKIETRRFAKNQRTWLRRLSMTPGCLPLACIAPPGSEAVDAILARITPKRVN